MRPNVLLIQQVIPSYRIPIFNLLAESVDLTVVYESGAAPEGARFAVKKVGLFHIPRVGKVYRGGLRKLTQGYDVVINSYDTPVYVARRLARLKRRGFGLVHWGIGVSASYGARYDEDDQNKRFYDAILRVSDACVFYSDYPAKKYAAQGWPEEKMFTAPNTALVCPDDTPQERDTLLFVGSLYPQKGFDELLEQYDAACRENPNVPRLVIVGDGSERGRIESWVTDHGLSGRVAMTGAIFDDAALGRYFARAAACVSPNQAGLTVLKSMGCGVPYITRRDAITGGELFNIQDRVNGVLYDRPAELKEILLDLTEHPETYMLYGNNARIYYEENRKPEDMVDGFLAAIRYAQEQSEKRRKRR